MVFADLSLRPEARELVDQHSTGADGKARAVFVKTDVVHWDQLTGMFDAADREFGGVDIVCPGAGVYEPRWSNFWHPPGTSTSKDAVHDVGGGVGHYASLDINLTHPIRTTQLAISRWLNPSRGGDRAKVSPQNPKRVVHVSSIAAQVPNLTSPLYAASKAGLNHFIRALAPLDRLGIRVTGVAPGVIRTPLWTEDPALLRWIDETKDSWVEPEEVSEAMLQCCEDPAIEGGHIMEILKNSRTQGRVEKRPGVLRAKVAR